MNLQPIFDVAEICHQLGVKDAILSPGSRCAPLTLAFARHPKIKTKTISDERSAAFVALGMSQQTEVPTVLICTSGSAALNYAPAIAEAYFQHVPLIVITADRPPEWIDQQDGQTIRQQNIYGEHIKKSFQFPVDLNHDDAKWHGQRMVSEAFNSATSFPSSPVHINIPFREPFYPSDNDEYQFDAHVKVIKQSKGSFVPDPEAISQLLDKWSIYNKKIIVGGQQKYDNNIVDLLSKITTQQKVPVLGDIISNLHAVENIILHSDVFLGQSKNGLHESLQPELLVTFGNSTISKNLKLFLRHRPIEHWHIQEAGQVADTYQSLTNIVNCTPEYFLQKLIACEEESNFDTQKKENFYHLWEIEERKSRRLFAEFFPHEQLKEFEVIFEVMSKLDNVDLHLANSMAVRYANYIGLNKDQKVNVFANRGTSGIDGSTSTAMGSSLASGRETILITGDMAFFYDRNAFWHNYSLKNLKVLVLNNHAGGIFRMINGPASQPELEEYFETNQRLSAKHLASEFDIPYLLLDKRSKLNNLVKEFISSDGPIILEFESESQENVDLLKAFKSQLNNMQ
ncbi:MAG: 2-succinyl-5-enolpyruvyl-6-hydroxy-3-cyclohexene-1-carboxylic-acid synthase [Fulvivirga sp.]